MEAEKTPILILGTGPEARVALDIANRHDVLVYGFLTEEAEHVNEELNDILVVAQLGEQDADTLLTDEQVKLVVAARETTDRQDLVAAVSDKKPEIITLVDPDVSISAYAKISSGALIYPGVRVMANTFIDGFALIMSNVSIGTDVQIGEYVTIEAGAVIGNGVAINDEVFIGAGAVIQPGVTIGNDANVGAGSVVLRDVPDGATVFGNPAQVIES